jgi:hypothetical protein
MAETKVMFQDDPFIDRADEQRWVIEKLRAKQIKMQRERDLWIAKQDVFCIDDMVWKE